MGDSAAARPGTQQTTASLSLLELQTAKPNDRVHRHDLDWLRVLVVIGMVFVFHCGRFFDTDGWHVKNPVRHQSVTIWTGFLVTWMMPLIFFISGASTWYALKSRSVGIFVKERALRLLVPCGVGIFTHVAFQVYLERRSFAGFQGTFLDFYPRYFEGWYGFGGNFAWMGLHLWYLEMLFVYSILLLPLLSFLTNPAGNRTLDHVGGWLAKPGVVYLLAIPQMILTSWLNPHSIWGQRGFGGWPFPVYVFLFLFGFLLVSRETLEARIHQQSSLTGILAAALVMLSLVLWRTGPQPHYGTMRSIVLSSVWALTSWCLVLCCFNLARRYLGFDNRVVRYANEGVLPFYVLHQSVILAIGFYVVQWHIPDLVKFALIAILSFTFIAASYEFLIRRFNILRFLFGMKLRKQKDRERSETFAA